MTLACVRTKGLLTPCKFVSRLGRISFTARCTRTPPIILKHLRLGSLAWASFSVVITALFNHPKKSITRVIQIRAP